MVFRIRKHLANRLQHTHALVADDELHALKDSTLEPRYRILRIVRISRKLLMLIHFVAVPFQAKPISLGFGLACFSVPVAFEVDAVHIHIRIFSAER